MQVKITKAEARILRDALNASIAKGLTFLHELPAYYARERELLAVLAKVRRVRRLERFMRVGGR